MIVNPDWLKPKEKPYFLQISLDCIEKLVECIKKFNKGEIDADTSSKIENQILENELDDPEFLNFAIEHYSEMFGYINIGRVNIRIHKDIEGKMWFGGQVKVLNITFSNKVPSCISIAYIPHWQKVFNKALVLGILFLLF